MLSLLGGMLGGFVAWIATMIIGQPVISFLALRKRAAAVLARYEEQVDYNAGPEEYNDVWVNNRWQEYTDCGNDLIAFQAANAFVTSRLRKLPKKWRCSPKAAGSNFLLLADLEPGGYEAHRARSSIVAALKLGYWQ